MDIRKSEKDVINAFIDGKPASSKKLSTDGRRLDGLWMGGTGIADRSDDGMISFNDLGSKAAQTVQNAVRKMTPKNFLATVKVANSDFELVAVPLDGSKSYYFATKEEYEAVLDMFKSRGVEEWETQLVEGPNPEILSKILGNYPSQDTIEYLFDEVEFWTDEQWARAAFAIGYNSRATSEDIITAVDNDELVVFSGTLDEFISERVDDLGIESFDPEMQGIYFDFEDFFNTEHANGNELIDDEMYEMRERDAGLALIELMYEDGQIPEETYKLHFDYELLGRTFEQDGGVHEVEVGGSDYIVEDAGY